MIEKNNEQWKSEGYCEQCRRQDYCRKKCTAHKRRLEREMHQIAEAVIAKKLFREER